MHSFASALIAAALATLSSAAPVGLPAASLAASVSVPLSTNLPLPTGTIPLGEVKPVTDPEVPGVHARAAALSVAAIFTDIQTKIQPYTEQLSYIAPSNITIDEITNLVFSIKAPIIAAVPDLQALAGQADSVILAPVTPIAGDAELSVSQVASIVGVDINLTLGAAGVVLDVANAKGGEIVADVKDVLTDLGCAVTDLVGAVLPLVNNLSASLDPVVAPVRSVVSDLNLNDLAIYLGLVVG